MLKPNIECHITTRIARLSASFPNVNFLGNSTLRATIVGAFTTLTGCQTTPSEIADVKAGREDISELESLLMREDATCRVCNALVTRYMATYYFFYAYYSKNYLCEIQPFVSDLGYRAWATLSGGKRGRGKGEWKGSPKPCNLGPLL